MVTSFAIAFPIPSVAPVTTVKIKSGINHCKDSTCNSIFFFFFEANCSKESDYNSKEKEKFGIILNLAFLVFGKAKGRTRASF